MKTVIGRAYGDEPIKLMVIGERGASIAVIREGFSGSIYYRKEWIYRFDLETLTLLREAYESGNSEELRRLWRRANRYEWTG